MAMCVAMLIASFALTFTISDYYIFNRISQYGIAFVLSQWIKKAGIILLPMAIFLKSRNAADAAKYILPAAVIVSLCTFGDFFDITKTAETEAEQFYNSINLFMPKWLNILLFSVQSVSCVCACGSLFIKYGFGVKSPLFLRTLICTFLAVTPLNIFENFFDINDFPADSFWRFYSLSVWHLAAVIILITVTVISYLCIKNKNGEGKLYCLRVMAMVLLLQYHSKDSMIIGDGYNMYNTLFSCIPLFICNLGVYVASLTVFLNKKPLYPISFFVHAAGAISVFFYFGKDSLSNYGLFCSYTALYFVFTHCLLFAICVNVVALKLYIFRIKDCIIPLVYYFLVIVTASVASALVTSYSIEAGLTGSDILYPNYAFTQINPLPFEVPAIFTVTLWHYDINILYETGLYIFYVAIFFTFYGLYRIWLALISVIFKKKAVT